MPEGSYYLADGLHRLEAAKKLQKTEIGADIKKGTLKEAKAYALQANGKRGLPLNRSERARATKGMLILYPERANQWIAEEMGVSDMTVKKYRGELESMSQIGTLDYFIRKDGKRYPREIKQPSWRDDASQGVIEAVEANVFSKEVAKALAEYDHVAQDAIANQIEAMSERPSNEILIEGIQQLNGVADNFQWWVDEQIVDDDVDEPPTETVEPELDDVEDEPIEAAVPAMNEVNRRSGFSEPDEAEPEASDIERTSTIEVEEPEPEELCCYDHYVSLDEIKEYVGERVDVVVSAGKGKTVEYRGEVLGVTEQMGEFSLNIRTDLGRKLIQTGTTIGKFRDVGILEIRGRHKSTGQTQEAEAPESEATERTAPVVEIEPQVDDEQPETQADESAEAELESPASETKPQIEELEDLEPPEEELDIIDQANDIESLIDAEEASPWKKEGYESKEEYDADLARLNTNDTEIETETDETVKAKNQESQSPSFADIVSQPCPEEMQTETESDTIDEEYHFEPENPEMFQEFLAHFNWIDEYVRGLKSQECIELIMFVRSQLEALPTILEIPLKELRAGQENENAVYEHEQLEFVANM